MSASSTTTTPTKQRTTASMAIAPEKISFTHPLVIHELRDESDFWWIKDSPLNEIDQKLLKNIYETYVLTLPRADMKWSEENKKTFVKSLALSGRTLDLITVFGDVSRRSENDKNEIAENCEEVGISLEEFKNLFGWNKIESSVLTTRSLTERITILPAYPYNFES